MVWHAYQKNFYIETLETTEFWYCGNWKQIDFCECDYCVFLNKVHQRVEKIYSIECVKLPVFISNLDAFFKFICLYNDRDWFQNFLYFFRRAYVCVFCSGKNVCNTSSNIF